MKKKILVTSIIISSVAALSFLLLFLIVPNSEKAYRKQVHKQHEIFCSGLLQEPNAFVENQISQHKFVYCTIEHDSATVQGKKVQLFSPIIHYDDKAIRLKVKDLSNKQKYYQLDDSTQINDVQDLAEAISFYETENHLVSALSPERMSEINKIPKNDSVSRMLSVVTNLLIGSDSLYLAAYVENDSLKYLTSENVCSYYVDLDSLDSWKKNDTKALYTEQSLYEFLLENRLIKPIPYRFVRMNFRDDKFFIGNRVEKFSAGNAELQRKCMNNHFVVLYEKEPSLLEKQNQNLGEHIKWCQPDWLEKAKEKSLNSFNVELVKNKEYLDWWRTIYLCSFIVLMLISGILLYFLWRMVTDDSSTDGEDVPTDILEDVHDNSKEALEKQLKSLTRRYETTVAENKELIEKVKLLERDSQSLRENIADLEKENSTNLQNAKEAKKENKELKFKYNELVGKYNALVAKYESLKKEIDKQVEEAIETIKLQYSKIEKQYNEILPYYNATLEIIKQLVPYLQGIIQEKDLRFWDRVILQQIAIHKLLIPLSKVWSKEKNVIKEINLMDVMPVAESTLEKMRTDSLQQYIFLYLEKTLRYDNITSQDFSQVLNEKIPQEIANNYNTKVKQLQVADIAINPEADKKYKECVDLLRLKVAQLKLDESFKAKMWSAFGKEFIDNVDEMTDKKWFFKYVIALAYYTAEYLQFNTNKSTDTSSYYNLTYLQNGFDSNYPKEYEHNYYGKSNTYADRIYEWCKELGIEHLQVLISEYLILP